MADKDRSGVVDILVGERVVAQKGCGCPVNALGCGSGGRAGSKDIPSAKLNGRANMVGKSLFCVLCRRAVITGRDNLAARVAIIMPSAQRTQVSGQSPK